MMGVRVGVGGCGVGVSVGGKGIGVSVGTSVGLDVAVGVVGVIIGVAVEVWVGGKISGVGVNVSATATAGVGVITGVTVLSSAGLRTANNTAAITVKATTIKVAPAINNRCTGDDEGTSSLSEGSGRDTIYLS
jgi:hypothetical protein